jgi:hypothetical protein
MKIDKWKVRAVSNFLFLIATIALVACSSHKVLVKSYQPEKIVHMRQLMMQDDTKSLGDYAAYVEKGDTIPLALSLDTDFMTFKQDQIDIVAKKRLYFMIQMPDNLAEDELAKIKKIDAQTLSQWSDAKRKAFFKKYMLYLSTDAVHWAPLSSVKALREVLGYRAGTVSFGMAASTTNGLGASLNIKTVK